MIRGPWLSRDRRATSSVIDNEFRPSQSPGDTGGWKRSRAWPKIIVNSAALRRSNRVSRRTHSTATDCAGQDTETENGYSGDRPLSGDTTLVRRFADMDLGDCRLRNLNSTSHNVFTEGDVTGRSRPGSANECQEGKALPYGRQNVKRCMTWYCGSVRNTTAGSSEPSKSSRQGGKDAYKGLHAG